MMAKCHDCERYWERIQLEPIYSHDSGDFIWLCPECWEDMLANSEP